MTSPILRAHGIMFFSWFKFACLRVVANLKEIFSVLGGGVISYSGTSGGELIIVTTDLFWSTKHLTDVATWLINPWPKHDKRWDDLTKCKFTGNIEVTDKTCNKTGYRQICTQQRKEAERHQNTLHLGSSTEPVIGEAKCTNKVASNINHTQVIN